MPLSAPFRVLLVDDDQLDRMAVRRALLAVAPAVTLIEAEDVASGMRCLQQAAMDCLLLDYHLPDGLGRELLEHVRKSSTSLPVIMLTGVADAGTAVELMKAGATDYIPKSLLSAERLERSLRYAMRIRDADERVRRYSDQLHALSGAALRINATSSLDAMVERIAEEARVLVGAVSATAGLLPTALLPSADTPTQVLLDHRAPQAGVLDAPLLAHDGAPLGHLSIRGNDDRTFSESDHAIITQLAQLAGGAIENARLLETARAATQARDDMLAIVSHDLRNPVQTIMMATMVLLELSPADDRRNVARQQVDIIMRSASRANRLIEDLLDATRIDAGTFSVETAAASAEGLVREAIDLLAPLAEAAGIALTHDVEGGEAHVMADSQRILQVFSNLGGNAIKFTPRGGRVSISATRRNAAVCFTVSDTGRGIASSDLSQIFNRYWQARDRGKVGAGLGLWIAKGIVEAHGGQIDVESTPNSGTTVRFTLPGLPTQL